LYALISWYQAAAAQVAAPKAGTSTKKSTKAAAKMIKAALNAANVAPTRKASVRGKSVSAHCIDDEDSLSASLFIFYLAPLP
jgi:hypothetical protein